MKKRAHIRTAFNAANVSKDGDHYTIGDVCCAVRMCTLYLVDRLTAGASTL